MAGNIKVIEPTSKYQKVPKAIILDKEIDVYTLGIYVKVLALGKEWDLNVIGFAAYLGVTEAKIRRSFARLEQAGYIRRLHIKDPKTGRFTGWDYEVGVEPFPEAERSNLTKTQPLENPQGGNPTRWETHPLENQHGINKELSGIENKNEVKTSFNFKAALLGIGVSESTANQWLEVRRRKGAVNTELAFKDLVTEIGKTGMTAEECVAKAAAESWRGFKASYLAPRENPNPRPLPRQQQEGAFAAAERIMNNINRKYQNLQSYDEQ